MIFVRHMFESNSGDIAWISLNELDITSLLETLKKGINCSALQNTEGGRRVIDLIAQLEGDTNERVTKINKLSGCLNWRQNRNAGNGRTMECDALAVIA